MDGVSSWGVIRFPKYLFRPKQCDALHFDLWHCGVNLLRDGGTYSYNSSKFLDQYFPSVEAHNTIQIDGHNQMARIGRFMYGDWISAYNIKNKSNGVSLHENSGNNKFPILIRGKANIFE